MEPYLTPPMSDFVGINSRIKLFLWFIRDSDPYDHRGEAEEWIQGVIDDLGLEGNYFLEYSFQKSQYTFYAIAEGNFEPQTAYHLLNYSRQNPFHGRVELVRAVNKRLEKFDIYEEDFQINIIDFEVVEVE